MNHEIEMGLENLKSWDLDPHRIYVASLSDDDDEDDDDDDDKRKQKQKQKEEEEEAEELFRLNSLVANGLSPNSSSLLKTSNRLRNNRSGKGKQVDDGSSGALILYQPLPTPTIGKGKEKELDGGGREGETRIERIRREESERRKELEFMEFRRESERIEADDELSEPLPLPPSRGDQGGGMELEDGGGGIEVEMEIEEEL